MESSEHGQPAEGAVSSTSSTVSGTAGNVVQARDVHGDIHVHAETRSVRPALRQLPADTALFTGRDDELDRLLALAGDAESEGSPGAVVINAIDGMGGIGKTTLAVRAAHRLARRFPDGQLFLDLHGFTQGSAPRDPADALAVLLDSLGVPPGRIPADLEARAAFYRDRLVGTRTLIVLDNALDEAQVAPLLPAAETCLVLITSRRRLKALDDALPLPLDVLAIEDAVALLRKAARLDITAADEPLLERAAELCGRLPLALVIAGALLRTGGNAWNLTLLIDRLAARRPGHELAGYTDETRNLQAVFDMSYRNLPEDQQQLFRSLGLLPGPEIDAYAAAALLQTDPDHGGRLLQRLADHSLLTGTRPGRYRLHDLVRTHARTLAATLDSEPAREAAEGRLLHYYAHTAQSASVPIARLPRPAPPGPAPAYASDLTDPAAARAWLRIEYPNLQAAHAHAGTHALDGHAIALAAGLAEILQADGPWSQALEIHQAAVEAAEHQRQPAALTIALTDLGRMCYQIGDYPGAADTLARSVEVSRRLGDRLAEANALTNLGYVRHVTGQWPGVGDDIVRALEIFRGLGNRLGEANALRDLGRVRYLIGDYPAATDIFAQALEISSEIGDRVGEATALNFVGRVRCCTGDYSWATDAITQGLEISRRIGDRRGEAIALSILGRAQYLTRDLPGAAETLARALEISRRMGDPIDELGALTILGRVRSASGDLPGAVDTLTQALELCRRMGDRADESWVLTHYAATIAATGDHPRALSLYHQALALSREQNRPPDEAASLEGIAERHLATGDTVQGIEHLRHALQIYQRLGMHPDIERVTARLAE